MVQKINVETVLKYLGQGVSKPALIIGNDYRKYVLKTQKVIDNNKLEFYDCMFLNELLAYQIAIYLGVPIPEAAIAYLDGRIINNDPEITFVHRFYEGNLFASLALDNIEENLVENYVEMIKMRKPYISRTWNSFFSNIVNAEDIAKIIAFDILIANFDRYGNTGNLLISNTETGRKVFTIDHGHAFFGPKWETNKINCLRLPSFTMEYISEFVNSALLYNVNQGFADGLGSVFHAIEPNIDLTNIHNHSFMDTVFLIENIKEDLIDEWLSQIPKEWFVREEMSKQISYYKNFILKQKDLVRHIIQHMAERNAFTNFLGGELKWKTEKNVGTV